MELILLILISAILSFIAGFYKGKNNTNKKILKMLEEDNKIWLEKYGTQK